MSVIYYLLFFGLAIGIIAGLLCSKQKKLFNNLKNGDRVGKETGDEYHPITAETINYVYKDGDQVMAIRTESGEYDFRDVLSGKLVLIDE